MINDENNKIHQNLELIVSCIVSHDWEEDENTLN